MFGADLHIFEFQMFSFLLSFFSSANCAMRKKFSYALPLRSFNPSGKKREKEFSSNKQKKI